MGADLPLVGAGPVFAVLFTAILLAPILAARLRIPRIVGLILAGLAIGPTGLGVLAREGVVESLAGAGLLYLMFIAGLELDLDGFVEHRRDSVVFGATTFMIPMVINTGVAMALGFDLLASLLLASAFTSHTLVVYPVIQHCGLARNRSVTATLGATLIAVLGALLVLALIAGVHEGGMDGWLWTTLVGSLIGLTLAILFGLPRLTRWFFRGFGQDRDARFVFVLIVLFAVAAVTDVLGIEAIVGAFLAGLALNRFVPDGSVLQDRLRFLGNNLLVPLFLIGTGMLIDPRLVVADATVIAMGGALTVGALGAKLLAAWPAARYVGARPSELAVMFSLSSGQAAGALAAAIVASDIGLIGQDAVNAVILVMLATCVVAGVVAEHYAPLAPRTPRRQPRLGHTVVVAIESPQIARPLVRLAAHVAAADNGSVVPVNVLPFAADPETVDEHRQLAGDAEKVALGAGAEAQTVVRIDTSPHEGVLHTVVEHHGTAVVIGWKGYTRAAQNFFGGVIDQVLRHSPVPVLVCRVPTDAAFGRVVVSVRRSDLGAAGWPGLELAFFVARRLAQGAAVELLVVAEDHDPGLGRMVMRAPRADLQVDGRPPPIALRDHSGPGDLVVTGSPPRRAGLGHDPQRLARALPDRSLMVVVPRR